MFRQHGPTINLNIENVKPSYPQLSSTKYKNVDMCGFFNDYINTSIDLLKQHDITIASFFRQQIEMGIPQHYLVSRQLTRVVNLMVHNGVEQVRKLEVKRANFSDNFITFTIQRVQGYLGHAYIATQRHPIAVR